MRPSSVQRRVLYALVVLGLFGGAYLQTRSVPTPPVVTPQGTPEVAATGGAPLPPAPTRKLSGVGGESAARGPGLEMLREGEERLAAYRLSTRYPPGSRPAKEHPDQMTPRVPIVRHQPLISKGLASEDVRVQLGQDRRELVGDEVVRLWLRCEDSQSKVLPCRVPQASVMIAPASDGNVPPTATRFADDGQGGDERAEDGTLTASVQPSALGFGQFHGPVRVQLAISIGSEQGSAFFDVMYTPEAPARFTGTVRESLVGGSLLLSLGVTVTRPGRYFVIGRIDDHHDEQVAYLEWDGMLAAGPQTVPLTVFGKLIRDQRPELPLQLRDVEGYLFLDDSAPDRMHLPRLAGVVHQTRIYSLADFSDAEWNSEQKQRYLEEYQKDVERAREAAHR